MRFTLNGRTFAVEFQREHKIREVWVDNPAYKDKKPSEIKQMKKDGVPEHVPELRPSKFPYTTARVVEILQEAQRDAEGQVIVPAVTAVFQEAVVGARHNEKFDPEMGRRFALRNLTRTLPREMRPIVWRLYMGRKGRKK